MTQELRFVHASRIAWLGFIGLILFAAFLAIQGNRTPAVYAAPPAKNAGAEPPHADAAFEAALQKAMDGPVDVFVDSVEIQEQKPLLQGVRFDGLVDVTGKHLLRFATDKNERWLIDPDTVLAFRIAPKKVK